jgi:anti-sigma B factor antagonist
MVRELPVEITVTAVEHHALITVVGEVDIATSAQLRDACLEALDLGGDVELDLGAVQFLDSSGISVLVQTRQRVDRLGRRFAIRAASRPVRRVLEISGLDGALGIPADPGGA